MENEIHFRNGVCTIPVTLTVQLSLDDMEALRDFLESRGIAYKGGTDV